MVAEPNALVQSMAYVTPVSYQRCRHILPAKPGLRGTIFTGLGAQTLPAAVVRQSGYSRTSAFCGAESPGLHSRHDLSGLLAGLPGLPLRLWGGPAERLQSSAVHQYYLEPPLVPGLSTG